MLPNLSNMPIGGTSAHCADYFESKWDALADSIQKKPCDPTDRSDPRYGGCQGPYPRDVADRRFDANPHKPAFNKGDRVRLVDRENPISPRDTWFVGNVTGLEIDQNESTKVKRFRYVGEAKSPKDGDGDVIVFSRDARGLELIT